MSLGSQVRSWASELTGYFVYLLLIGTLGPFLFGFHLAELNAPQDVISCAKKSITASAGIDTNLPQCIPMNNAQIGLVSSIFTLGGLVGALVAGPASVRYGRLFPMRATTAFFTLGPVAEAAASSMLVLAIGRFLSGIGAGAALVIVPIYISEISPPKGKGLFGAFTQVMINLGIFLAQLLGYFLSHGQMWRIILGVGGVIGLLQLGGLTLAVDSPKWRADIGQPDIAKRDLKRIRGVNANINQEISTWDVDNSETEDEQDTLLAPPPNPNTDPRYLKRKSISIPQAITTAPYTRATISVMIVMVAQQLTGINSIVMYGVHLLSDLLQANSALLNVCVSLLNVVMTTLCAPLVDTLGRKKCLLLSIGGMGTSSILLGIGIRSAIPLLSAIAVLFFVASFAVGLGPVPFILASELVGPEAVGATQSWALAANWIATFIVAQFFPIVNERLGKGLVYFVFAALAVVFFVFVSFLVPETMGKKDADEVWGREPRRED